MEARGINDYIYLGLHLRYLRDAREGWPVHGEQYILANIGQFLEELKTIGLPTTRNGAADLIAFRKKLEITEQGRILSASEATELSIIMQKIDTILTAEAAGKFAFILTDKRIDVYKLLLNVGSLMASGVFEKMPNIAQYDFAEAGKCIAFERPTAAAFHLLRGTEAMLREFYCDYVKRDRVDSFLWGPMIKHLKGRTKQPPKPLLNHLDNIRENYRNPTLHPEMRYDMDLVQDLFGLCVEAVNRMIQDLKKRKR